VKRSALTILLALGACGPAVNHNVSINEPAPANEVAMPQTVPANPGRRHAAPFNTADEVEPTFPEALHGRWGLVPADCTSTLGDAKGLVTITADQVRFYESVARPAKIAERTDRVIRGEFAFTGEGQEWTTYVTWSVTGDRLSRIDAEPASQLVYTRC
jgi:hypothetical protein